MLSRRQLLTSAGGLLALAACAPVSRSAAPSAALGTPTADEQLSRLFEAMFQEQLAESPEYATSLGFDKGERAAAKGRLDDRSPAGLARAKRLTSQQLRRLQAIDRAALGPGQQVNYDSVMDGLARSDAANQRFDYGDEGAGRPYVVSQLTGAYQGVPDFLGTQHTIETAQDAEAYLSRLSQFGTAMDQEIERVRHDAGLGVIPPDFIVERTLTQMRGLRVAPDRSALVSSLADRTKAKGIAGDWRGRASRIYEAEVVPALDRQIALMTTLRPETVHDAGVWRLPDGEAYYALALRNGTTTTLSADEVHQMGLDQARALSARADVLLRGQGMSKGTVAQRIQALFRERKHRYPNTDKAKEQLIADLNGLVRAMQARLPDYFATLPKAPVEIRRVPKFIEAGAPGGYYNQPALDGSRPGIYWINLRDTAEVPKWTLPTVTYHEAIPGHHLQISLQQQADLPMIRRSAVISSYVEGWALYAEELAQEMGAYDKDPPGELGYLQAALFRAARLVVDTGLHAKRWSREQAIQAMVDIDGAPKTTAATEVERYCVWPGQATSYMTGKLTWLRLREKAKAALGSAFDIRQFHDAGLKMGAMPLTVLETVIDQHIASRKAA